MRRTYILRKHQEQVRNIEKDWPGNTCWPLSCNMRTSECSNTHGPRTIYIYLQQRWPGVNTVSILHNDNIWAEFPLDLIVSLFMYHWSDVYISWNSWHVILMFPCHFLSLSLFPTFPRFITFQYFLYHCCIYFWVYHSPIQTGGIKFDPIKSAPEDRYCPQQRRGVLQRLPWSPSQLRQPHVHDVCLDPSYVQRTACVQGWDGWVRSSTRRTSSVIRYLTVVCRIPTGWFNRIRKSLISLFLSGWSSQIFQISSTSRFASIYLDQEEEEWKQMLAEAPVLDVSTSDFWFFAASRDLTLRLGMLLLGWFCRLFPAIFGWCASWSKFLTLVDIYIYTISSKNELPHPSFPFQTQPTNRTFNCKANHLMSIATALTQLPQTDLQALTTDLGRSCQRFEMISLVVNRLTELNHIFECHWVSYIISHQKIWIVESYPDMRWNECEKFLWHISGWASIPGWTNPEPEALAVATVPRGPNPNFALQRGRKIHDTFVAKVYWSSQWKQSARSHREKYWILSFYISLLELDRMVFEICIGIWLFLCVFAVYLQSPTFWYI